MRMPRAGVQILNSVPWRARTKARVTAPRRSSLSRQHMVLLKHLPWAAAESGSTPTHVTPA
ncbi:uncharacterized protein B0I36DRAFT_314092 [Microdochium trichocladiopsis]|uniref:Uncharacterized protein n=1 Tax=Microdochium trichocladiopsis TaxID=1682393 RepID=A0A9P8YGA6_9PEZI|nr:uncharacterized protein B0I36DRAFT_314092 [Microdochium trichocladiopsis]KAH7037449.1 hypothetical protein B0I36DRAFT_314092 [Microdochium trichocladiopsis]